jgi:thiol-disulfide isomerase/thioredoxin
MKEKIIIIVLVILIIIVIYKLFTETSYYNDMKKTFTNVIKKNSDFEKFRDMVVDLTNTRINQVAEQSYVEGFRSDNAVMDLSHTGFLSKNEKITLYLFYKPTCPHSVKFMPTWYKVINDLPTNVYNKDIDCSQDRITPSQYNVNGVPTVVLEMRDKYFTYVGDRSYNDINRFLKEHSVNLVKRGTDYFDNLSGYEETPEPTNMITAKCPLVTFDKEIDIKGDSYRYQIFSENGQYGYAEGGNNDDKIMSPYIAAYSVVDSYLSSLPDLNNPGKTTLNHVDECTTAYADDISCFGLCDLDQLNKIENYQKDINTGSSTPRIKGTDYTKNKKIVNAIKKACNL